MSKKNKGKSPSPDFGNSPLSGFARESPLAPRPPENQSSGSPRCAGPLSTDGDLRGEFPRRRERVSRNYKPGRKLGRLGVLAVAAAVLGLLAYFLFLRPAGEPALESANVLLITLDTTRADRLGSYGYAQARTPHLDGLARDGVRFARAYCPTPLTLPSHCTILSGLYPVAHGVRNNGRDLAPGIRTLAEILKGRGFATAAFVSSFSVDSRFGIGRGFDVFDDTFSTQSPLKSANAERRAEDTFARFSRWLDSASGSRFFAWVHYYDPHLPYDPPSPYKEESAGRPYDGEIAYMDHYVGAVLERLKAKGLLERTIVVVAGDHGEGLGDKVETGHGVFLYEETLRVPLILHNRAVFPRPRVVESAVRLVDIAPTILETVGLESESSGMQGRSLIARARGKESADLDSLVETLYPRENYGWSELVGLVSGRWKFIQAPKPELYDLGRDPGEMDNLFAASAAKAGEMAKTLEQEIVRLSAGPQAVAGRPADSAEVRERLRSLGYVNFAPAKTGGAPPPDPKDKINLLKLFQQAQAFEFEQRFPDAERVYNEILTEIPDAPEAYVNLAIAQAMQKGFDRAIATLLRGVGRLPDSEDLLVRLGHTYLVTGRAREALETMQKVLAMNPSSLDALIATAGILDGTGRKDEARTYFERALAIEPENRPLRVSYAASLGSVGRFREAIAVYEGLIADYPGEQAFYQFAGIAHSFLGEYDKAISRLRQAVAIRPTPVGYFNLAVAYERVGDLKAAAAALRLYLENAQGESDANIRRARAELESLEKKLAGRAP
jgi:arylsulfatase A-like enzyme/tetratricopeptide (TPR) repeat protein